MSDERQRWILMAAFAINAIAMIPMAILHQWWAFGLAVTTALLLTRATPDAREG